MGEEVEEKLDMVEIQVGFGTDKFSYHSVEFAVHLPEVISFLDEDSPLIMVYRILGRVKLGKFMPRHILRSKIFLHGFNYLLRVLPRGCRRLCLNVWLEPTSSSGLFEDIKHFDVSIAPEIEESNQGGVILASSSLLNHVFHEFTQRLGGQVSSLSSSTVDHKLTIKPAEILEVTKQDDKNCCAICSDELSIGDKAYLTPCLHWYHSDCLSKWLDDALWRNQAITCHTCSFDLVIDHHVWSFKFIS